MWLRCCVAAGARGEAEETDANAARQSWSSLPIDLGHLCFAGLEWLDVQPAQSVCKTSSAFRPAWRHVAYPHLLKLCFLPAVEHLELSSPLFADWARVGQRTGLRSLNIVQWWFSADAAALKRARVALRTL